MTFSAALLCNTTEGTMYILCSSVILRAPTAGSMILLLSEQCTATYNQCYFITTKYVVRMCKTSSKGEGKSQDMKFVLGLQLWRKRWVTWHACYTVSYRAFILFPLLLSQHQESSGMGVKRKKWSSN